MSNLPLVPLATFADITMGQSPDSGSINSDDKGLPFLQGCAEFGQRSPSPMAVSQHFMCWKCDQRMDNHCLYYWLQLNKRTFENIAMGSTILTIGLGYFKKLRVACPIDLEEQRAIAGKLKSMDALLFKYEADVEKLKYQKRGLMQDLLTGKVPVKIADTTAVPA